MVGYRLIPMVSTGQPLISYSLVYLLFYWPDQQIGEGDSPFIVNPKTQCWAAIISLVLPELCLCQVAASARIARAFISMRSASSASDFCATAITWVNQTFIEQTLQIRRIYFLPFALDV